MMLRRERTGQGPPLGDRGDSSPWAQGNTPQGLGIIQMSWSWSRKEQPDMVWKQQPTQKGIKELGAADFLPSAI